MDTENCNMSRKEVARIHAQVAFQQRSDYIDYVEQNGDMPSFGVIQELEHRCLTAEQEYRDAYYECSCKPDDALVCLSCREYNKRKYGDRIPFRGE